MANVRIKDLTTTAATTASDDFFGVDGATNGTRKLNAFSPTFGGNLTVSGTGTSSFAGPVTGTSSVNDYRWTLTGSGFGGPFLELNATNATNSNRFTGFVLSNNSTTQWVAQLRAGDGKFHIYDAVRSVSSLTVDVGPLNGVAGTTTVGGNLTVSGGTITGGTSGMSLAAGGTDQKITLTPSGNGFAEIVGGSLAVATFIKGGGFAQGVSLGTTGSVPFVQGYASNTFGSFANLTLQPSGSNVLIGTTTDSANGKLQLATHTTSAGGIGFGTDVSLYRSGTSSLSVACNGTFVFAATDNGAADPQIQAAGGKVTRPGYSFTGDNNTGLFSSLADTLYFSTGGTTALTLDSDQNATFAKKISANGSTTWASASSAQVFWNTGTGANLAGSGSSYDVSVLNKNGDLAFYVPTGTQNTTFAGNIKTAAPSGGTAATWRLGTVATVSPTSPNRTIEVEIGGTTYYIHAKTTNN